MESTRICYSLCARAAHGTIRALAQYSITNRIQIHVHFHVQQFPTHNCIHHQASFPNMDPAIARAVFTSALLRADADAPEIRREDAASFSKALVKAMNICTNRDIKVRMG
jgi:hypothetical protein